MDVKMINPILDAFANIIPQLGFAKIERKGLSLSGNTLLNKGVLINISVVGPLKGSILIGMSLDGAKKVAGKMMGGMEITEFNSLAQSAISELGNMVCANACTFFSQAEISGLDISPPTILIGKAGQVLLAVAKVVVVTFAVDDIDMDVYIGLMQ
ncbi:MAG: chemotaxis protein CheX [Veillonellales bacterium]